MGATIFQKKPNSDTPATVEAWQNQSEIVTRGSYVALFVGAEKDQMVEAFNAAGQAE